MNNIIRVSPSVLAKVVSGGGQNYGVPNEWITGVYGSGWPIEPVAAPRDVEIPRQIDYPMNVNATLTPRTGYSLMPFAALKEAYENVTECKIPVNMIWRELSAFRPRLIDDEENEVTDHPFIWMTDKPDGETPWNVWLTRFLKSTKVYDAPAVYLMRDHDTLTGLHYVDGSTLFVIVDQYGNIPKAQPVERYLSTLEGNERTEYISKLRDFYNKNGTLPDTIPAFTQMVHGIPYSWWDSDQIWYRPQNRRMDSPYGESFIEQAWSWVMIIVNLTAFELGHYRTGNMPEGFVTVPKDSYPTPDRVLVAEMIYNARMTGNVGTERNRLRMFPDGTKYIPTKKPDFPQLLYKQAFNNILHTIGIPPSEFGDIPGGGLGGKGFKEGSASELSRGTLNPHRIFVSGLFNYALEREGVDDVHFDLAYPLEEIDPDKQKTQLWEGFSHGIFSLNDVLGQLGYDPIAGSVDSSGNILPDHVANKHLIIAGASVYVMEDMQVGAGGLAVPEGQKPNQPDGKPIDEESAATQTTPHTPEDAKTLQSVLDNILGSGTVDGKKFSLPPKKVKKGQQIPTTAIPERVETHVVESFKQHAKDILDTPTQIGQADETTPQHDNVSIGVGEKADMPVLHGKVTTEEAKAIGDALHLDWSRYDLEQFRQGLEEEQEHAATVSGDVKTIANIVLDHLKEDPKYYEHLGKTFIPSELLKHCGVCPEDDDYFGAPVSREIEFAFPDQSHANDVEIVAMNAEGLPPKPALWKPEGGEVETLQERIGGPQYVREEAFYLLDRSLGFHLAPVAYVSETNGEMGAAIYYTMDAGDPHDPKDYAPEWIERAAVLDYIASQQDRGYHHNYFTNPDDPDRMILFDNGLSFPVDKDKYCESPFCELMLNKPLSSDTLASIRLCLGDVATWTDIKNLVGGEATQKARECAQRLLDEKMITPYHLDSEESTSTSGETPIMTDIPTQDESQS